MTEGNRQPNVDLHHLSYLNIGSLDISRYKTMEAIITLNKRHLVIYSMSPWWFFCVNLVVVKTWAQGESMNRH